MAAVAAAAAAAANPVLVAVPSPNSADPLYVLESASEVVVNTPFLPWQSLPAAAGAPARSGLPLSLVIKNFLSRSRIGPAAADKAAAQSASVLEAMPSAAFVARVLTEYCDSGLFRAPAASLLQFEAALAALSLSNPANMDIGAPDLVFGEAFATPGRAAVPARRGRGSSGGSAAVDAVPAIAGPAPLRFLSLVTLFQLFKPDLPVPMEAWSRLAGILGPVWTRAARDDEASQVRTMASVITPNLNKFLGCVGGVSAPDATLAINIPDFLAATLLPTGLRPGRQDGNYLAKEALDGFRYRLGNASDREAVEGQRISFLRST